MNKEEVVLGTIIKHSGIEFYLYVIDKNDFGIWCVDPDFKKMVGSACHPWFIFYTNLGNWEKVEKQKIAKE
jgi:hypothetical protein